MRPEEVRENNNFMLRIATEACLEQCNRSWDCLLFALERKVYYHEHELGTLSIQLKNLPKPEGESLKQRREDHFMLENNWLEASSETNQVQLLK